MPGGNRDRDEGGVVELGTESRSTWYAGAELTECSDWDEQDPDTYRMLAAPRSTGQSTVRRFDDPADPDLDDADLDDAGSSADDWGEEDTLVEELPGGMSPQEEPSSDALLSCLECDESTPLPGLHSPSPRRQVASGPVPADEGADELAIDELAIDELAIDELAIDELSAECLAPIDDIEAGDPEGSSPIPVEVLGPAFLEPIESDDEWSAGEPDRTGRPDRTGGTAAHGAGAGVGGAADERGQVRGPPWLRPVPDAPSPPSQRAATPAWSPCYDGQCGGTSAPDRSLRSVPPRIARRLWQRDMSGLA